MSVDGAPPLDGEEFSAGAEILAFPAKDTRSRRDGARSGAATPPPPRRPSGGDEGGGDDGRKPIVIKPGELARMGREAEDRLGEAPAALFQRGGSLVRPGLAEVGFANKAGGLAPALHAQALAGVYRALTERTHWQKFDGHTKKMVSRDPPKEVASIISSGAGQWRLPRISGVTSCPTLRPDGSLLADYGYDPATGIYSFWDGGDLAMPAAPTRQDAEEALDDLQHILREFPFVEDVDRSVAFSGLLSVVARGAMSVCPMHGITAPAPGSGKSFLIDLFAVLATGRLCPVLSASEDDAETEKRIVAALLSGFPLISIDNVNHQMRSDILCQAVERPLIHVRPLGSSAAIEIENRSCFFATGNGFGVSGDLVRRTLICRLDPRMERPETRDFEDNPVEVVLADRKRYLRAALVIVRAFRLSEESLDLPPVGSFMDWTETVRGALVWLGLPDPARAIETSRENDAGLRALRSVMAFLAQAFGAGAFSVTEIIEVIGRSSGDETGYLWPDGPRLPEGERGDFREILLSIAGVRGTVNGKRLSAWLSHNEGRCVGAQRVEKAVSERKERVFRWRIVEI